MPRVRHFMREFDTGYDPVPAADLALIPDIMPDRFDRDKHGAAAVKRWLKEQEANKDKVKENASEDG
jgi:hypothetical protein